MKIEKYKSISMGIESDDCSITCTNDEYEMLKYALELVGVNVQTSAGGWGNERTIHFKNAYRTAWRCKDKDSSFADEFFERNKKDY